MKKVYYIVDNTQPYWIEYFYDESEAKEFLKRCYGFHIEVIEEPDFYEPNDYEEGDIGSATVAEMRRQNGEL